MSLLALLAEGPSYGLRLKQEFERRTGSVWPLNVGQVYTSLDRLEREGLVRQVDGAGGDRQRLHEITPPAASASQSGSSGRSSDRPAGTSSS